MNMKIGFPGLGELGLPCALAVESCGHTAMGCEISEKVLADIRARKIAYHEAAAARRSAKSARVKKSSIPHSVPRFGVIIPATPPAGIYETRIESGQTGQTRLRHTHRRPQMRSPQRRLAFNTELQSMIGYLICAYCNLRGENGPASRDWAVSDYLTHGLS